MSDYPRNQPRAIASFKLLDFNSENLCAVHLFIQEFNNSLKLRWNLISYEEKANIAILKILVR